MPELEKIEIPFNDFETMLSRNAKILFSGIFGSGKTTFLNDFFEDNKEYESIYIYPVNYAVVSNKDIFELIKHDVLLQLLGKVSKEDFDKLEIPYQLTLWTYFMSNNELAKKADFLASFLSFAETKGRAFLKVYEQIKSLKDGFLEFHEKFQEDDFEQVEKYLNSATNEKGHVYEEDFYTELIRNLIEKLKEATNKKVVLVIDDLDRLDPEHIFRILNIFSAHIDYRNVDSDNKFDVDKVIIVCDYNNIASVFAHKYGTNADFNGFIDKFYNAIYWHNSSRYIKNIIDSYLKEINTGIDADFFISLKSPSKHISAVLKRLIDYKLINFRQLLKFDKKFDINYMYQLKNQGNLFDESSLAYYTFDAELIVYFFMIFFKNKKELLTIITKVKQLGIAKTLRKNDVYEVDRICELLMVINHKNVANESLRNSEPIILEFDNYLFHCKITRNRKKIEIINESISEKSKENPIPVSKLELDYFFVLEQAIKIYSDYIKYDF